MFMGMGEKGLNCKIAGLYTHSLWGDFIIRQDKHYVFLTQNCDNPDKFP